jgi:hypothetical protein
MQFKGSLKLILIKDNSFYIKEKFHEIYFIKVLLGNCALIAV